MQRRWCDWCRGGADDGDNLVKCCACPRRFHRECCSGGVWRSTATSGGTLTCAVCNRAETNQQDERNGKAAKASTKLVRAVHNEIRARSSGFYRAERARLAPFVSQARLNKLVEGGRMVVNSKLLRIGSNESYINAHLRDYQVHGVNWILQQVYAHTNTARTRAHTHGCSSIHA